MQFQLPDAKREANDYDNEGLRVPSNREARPADRDDAATGRQNDHLSRNHGKWLSYRIQVQVMSLVGFSHEGINLHSRVRKTERRGPNISRNSFQSERGANSDPVAQSLLLP